MNGVGLRKPKSVDNNHNWLILLNFISEMRKIEMSLAQCRLHNIIRAKCVIWVGTLNEQIVAYLAMNGSYIDRLYVDPSAWRQGWGTRFIHLAKQLSPHGLELHTHQENTAARALYERHGFRAAKFGISPPPESAPDVEYHWRP